MPNDPYRYFRIEAAEILDHIGKGMIDLERAGGPQPDRVAVFLRYAHTLKGAARVVKQQEIGEMAHEMEDAFAALKQSDGPPPRETIDRVLELHDEINGRLAKLGLPDTPPGSADGTETATDMIRTVRADADDVQILIDRLGEAQACLAALHRVATRVDRLRTDFESLFYDRTASRIGPVSAHDSFPGRETQNAGERLHREFGVVAQALTDGLDQLERDLGDIQGNAERLRLIPVKTLFLPLERAVRDSARALGKRAEFKGVGDDVRLDSRVLSTLQSALLHIVRNAVAHGIEMPAERTAAGKPETGSVKLEIVREGGHVRLLCIDDGRGIDLESVRAALEKKGIAVPAAEQTGNAEEVLKLLERGGISTSQSVSAIAGRGVGLEVVRDAVEQLGGETTIRTVPGQATEFELRVPVSLAAFEAVVIDSGSTPATIPMSSVRKVMRISAGDLAGSDRGQSIAFDGTDIPYMCLATDRSRASANGADQKMTAIVVAGQDGLAAIGVERILDIRTVVQSPLPELTPAHAFVAGTSQDIDGSPILAFHADGLVAAARAHRPTEGAETDARQRRVLVVDDSLTTRMLEQTILQSAGYVVDVASSGEEGLEKASKGHFDLVLVDVEMPGMNGFSVIEKIRADESLRGLPCVLVTSRSGAEDRRRGQQVGANAYIVKGEFDQSAFLQNIEQLIG